MLERFEKPKFYESLANWITGNNKWINTRYMEVYIGEVEEDVEILKSGMQECGFERTQNRLFQYLVKKYKNEFCPSTFSRFFS